MLILPLAVTMDKIGSTFVVCVGRSQPEGQAKSYVRSVTPARRLARTLLTTAGDQRAEHAR